MANKTIQALKISGSWTPNAQTAAAMAKAAFGKGDAAAVRIEGGRIAIKHSIEANYADPGHAVRVSARIAAIKAALTATGELHSFNVSAGAVPTGEAEVLAQPEPEIAE